MRWALNVCCSQDEGRTWALSGQLRGPAAKSTWSVGYEPGYPVSLRLSSGEFLVVYYGPWQDENSDVVGVFLDLARSPTLDGEEL
jgi:hypothetical protein